MIDFEERAEELMKRIFTTADLTEALRQLAADVLCEYADAKALQRFLVDDIRARATAIKDGKQ
jgi:hypothetical protein